MTSPAPPSQRAELLTQELESAMRKLSDCAKWGPANTCNRVTADEAAALLQHIAALQSQLDTAQKDNLARHRQCGELRTKVAALTQRVEALSARIEEMEPGAECWNALSACGRMKLLGATMAADHIGMEFWIHHDAKGDAQDLEGRDWFCRFMMKAVDAYRALSQEPRDE